MKWSTFSCSILVRELEFQGVVGLFRLLLHVSEPRQCAIWRAQGSSLEAQLLKSRLQKGKGSVALFANGLLAHRP